MTASNNSCSVKKKSPVEINSFSEPRRVRYAKYNEETEERTSKWVNSSYEHWLHFYSKRHKKRRHTRNKKNNEIDIEKYRKDSEMSEGLECVHGRKHDDHMFKKHVSTTDTK